MLKQIINKFIKNNKGFFLVDSMVGVLILAIGLTGLATLYTQGTNVSFKSDKMQAAVQVAGQEMERIKKFDSHTLTELKEGNSDFIEASTENGITYTHYVDMKGYLPQGSTKTEDKYKVVTEINTSSLTTSGTVEYDTYPISVTVSWRDPGEVSYKVYGYFMAKK